MYELFLFPVKVTEIAEKKAFYDEILFKKKNIPQIIDINKNYSNFQFKIESNKIIDGHCKFLLLQEEIDNSVSIVLEIVKEKAENVFLDEIIDCWRKNKNEFLEILKDDKMFASIYSVINDSIKFEDIDLNPKGDKKHLQTQFEILIFSERVGIHEENRSKIVQLMLPHSHESLGHAIILILNSIQTLFKLQIADYFLSTLKCKSIFRKAEFVSTVNRTTKYELLKGENDTMASHTESNIKFRFDFKNVYFNSKLSGVRDRLLKEFSVNQIVADLFCGIGPIAIRALKKGCYVICNDINEHAIHSLRNNIKLNKIVNNYEIYNDDAEQIIEQLETKNVQIDHFVFNLPEQSIFYIKNIRKFTKSRLHCFFFCHKNENVLKYLEETVKIQVNKNSISVCRDVSPSKIYYYMNVLVSEIQFNI